MSGALAWCVAITLALTGVGLAPAHAATSEFEVLTPPSITGTARVGSTLQAEPGEVTPAAEGAVITWLNGSTVLGTGETYVPTPADVRAQLSISVTWASAGFEEFQVASDPTAPVALATFSSFTPSLTGTAAPGSNLSVSGLPSGTERTYKWYRNSKVISGVTGGSYTVRSTDVGVKIRVAVWIKRPGYVTRSATSASVTVGRAFSATTTPALQGTFKVGRKIAVSPGTWKPGATFSYQWLRDGVPISGATSQSRIVVAADAGAALSVRVTGKRSGYATTSRLSSSRTVGLGTIEHDPPVLTGVVRPGSVVGVRAGIVTPSTVEVAYQWYRDGEPVDGATSATFQILDSDVNRFISARTTYSAPGYASTSDEAYAHARPSRAAVMVRPDFYSPSGAPGAIAIAPGDYRVGFSSTSCLWVKDTNMNADDGYVDGDTGAGYSTITLDDTDAYFYTENCSGWTPLSSSVPAVPVTADPDVTVTPMGSQAGLVAPSVSITGTPRVGGTLSVKHGDSVPKAHAYRYTWTVDGDSFDGGATLKVERSWPGKTIRVTVTPVRVGFDYATSSTATVKVSGSALAPDRPVIVGSAVQGVTLKTTDVASASATYQWLRDGKPISGARYRSYKVTSSDGGHRLSFRVTYKSQLSGGIVATSASTAVVQRVFTTAPTPTVSGSAALGSKLSASVKSWSSSPSLSYQWLRNGAKIPGATGKTWTIVEADKGTALTFTVTAKRSGYVAVTKSATAVKVRIPGEIWAPPALIKGTPRAGQTLTASLHAPYPSQSTRSIQWLRNGVAIPGATGTSLALKNRDVGATISVQVDYIYSGLPDRETTSIATAPIQPRPVGIARDSAVRTIYIDAGVQLNGVPPGRYTATGGPACVWWSDSPGVSTGTGPGHHIADVTDGHFGSYGCGDWRLDDGTGPPTPTVTGDGTFKVGVHIQPGLYQRSAEGNWCHARFADALMTREEYPASGFVVEASATVPVFASDTFFETYGCGTWTRIGDIPSS